MPAVSAAERMQNFLAPAENSGEAAATAPSNAPPQNPAAPQTRSQSRDHFEGAESFQREQAAQQMLMLQMQTKTNNISQQFQVLSAGEAKRAEIASSIISKFSH